MHDREYPAHKNDPSRREPTTESGYKGQQATPTGNHLLSAALQYSAKGWSVFPVPPGTKRSYKSAGHSNGRKWGNTRDEKEIRADWNRWPAANIGIPTGEDNGFFVIDADTLGGHGVDGIASLEALQEKYGRLSPTQTARTPSGGLHYYFRWPDNLLVQNSSSKLGPGIDVRGEGGMVIAPPSAKRDAPYEWINNLQIADAPQWLLDLLGQGATGNVEARRPGQRAEPSLDKIAAAMKIIPNDRADVSWKLVDNATGKRNELTGWDGWNTIMMAMWTASNGSTAGYNIALNWCRRNRFKFDERITHESWFKRYPSSPPQRLGVGTLFAIANFEKPDWQRSWDQAHGPILPFKDHVTRARKMLEKQRPNLRHHRGDFLDFHNGAYRVIDESAIDAETWDFLDKAQTLRKGRGADSEPALTPFYPDRSSVAETVAALKSITHLDSEIEAPCWLDGRQDPPASDLIAFPNGLLDLRDDKLHPTDPNFFSTARLGFNYSKPAAEAVNWLKFLDQIFAGDDKDEQIALLQEVLGYILSNDASLEKAFMLLGPKRSGKGTMLAVLRRLLAANAVTGPSLKSLGTNFGLAPLIGKRLAIIDDLRVGSPKEQDLLIENVLKIAGRGLFTIDRKYKSSWTGTLPVKLLFVSNVMPKLGDDSAALASRFITLTTRVSFYDQEDTKLLEGKLIPELLGILHWALTGLYRLRDREFFQETESSREARERLANLGSPVRAFIAERCKLDPNSYTEKGTLYSAFCKYAQDNGILQESREKFCEGIYAATGGLVRPGRPRSDQCLPRDQTTGSQQRPILVSQSLDTPVHPARLPQDE